MEAIVAYLFENQDLKYRDFHAKLVPSIDKERIIGVRTPVIRAFAKQLASNGGYQQFLDRLPHFYTEENNLHAALIAHVAKDIDGAMEHIERFLPHVDNWATCDTLAPKLFAKHPHRVSTKVHEWIQSPHTYTVRFGVVVALQFLLDKHFDPKMLTTIACIRSSEYYINMAIAWYLSYALIKQYQTALPLFEAKTMDRWVHNKAIQKATESYRIDNERKQLLRGLKST